MDSSSSRLLTAFITSLRNYVSATPLSVFHGPCHYKIARYGIAEITTTPFMSSNVPTPAALTHIPCTSHVLSLPDPFIQSSSTSKIPVVFNSIPGQAVHYDLDRSAEDFLSSIGRVLPTLWSNLAIRVVQYRQLGRSECRQVPDNLHEAHPLGVGRKEPINTTAFATLRPSKPPVIIP